MTLPFFVGRVSYVIGYPLFRLLLWRTTRAYVAVIYNNELLLIQNWLRLYPIWRLPGGGVGRKEQPIDAAVRELREELGIVVKNSDLAPVNQQPIRSRLGYDYFLFTLHVANKPAITMHTNDVIAVQYVKKDKLATTNLDEEPRAIAHALGWL